MIVKFFWPNLAPYKLLVSLIIHDEGAQCFEKADQILSRWIFVTMCPKLSAAESSLLHRLYSLMRNHWIIHPHLQKSMELTSGEAVTHDTFNPESNVIGSQPGYGGLQSFKQCYSAGSIQRNCTLVLQRRWDELRVTFSIHLHTRLHRNKSCSFHFRHRIWS